MAAPNITAAIDIGTSKTVVLIGNLATASRPVIIGFAELPTLGMRKGEITKFSTLQKKVHDTIHAAEESAGVQVRAAFLAVSGRHLSGTSHSGTANVRAANRVVSKDDVDRADAEAKACEPGEGRAYVVHIAQQKFLDGRECKMPIGEKGSVVGSRFWTITADESYLQGIWSIPREYGLNVSELVPASLASSAAVVNETMKKIGVLVIDIGGGTTDYVLYKNSHVVCTGVLPIGGDHITNDLCCGLRVHESDAERTKLLGSAIVSPEDAVERTLLRGDHGIGDKYIYTQSVSQIINARVDELFSILRDELGGKLNPNHIAAGAVITGGTSQLRGIAQVATHVLGIDAVIGKNSEWTSPDFTDPKYSTALGLLAFAKADWAERQKRKKRRASFFDSFLKLFNL